MLYRNSTYVRRKTNLCNDKKTQKSLGCSTFSARPTPQPKVKYGNMVGGPIPKRLLLASGRLYGEYYNLGSWIQLRLKSYQVSIAYNGDTVSYQGIGDRFTPEMHEAFAKLESGAIIYIEKAVIYTEDRGYITLGTTVFKVE